RCQRGNGELRRRKTELGKYQSPERKRRGSNQPVACAPGCEAATPDKGVRMETIITMIILTGMAVLFLSNIFRQVKDERERVEQRRAGLPRRPATSTEQFLEEVNRRRQQATERGKSSLPPIRPPAARSSRGALVPAPPPIRRETTAR